MGLPARKEHSPQTGPTPAEEIRAYLRKKTIDADEIDLPKLVEQVSRHARFASPDFLMRLGEEFRRRLVYEFVQYEYAPSVCRRRLESKRLRDVAADVQKQELRSIFSDWYEEVERGRKVSLLALSYEELELAASKRDERAQSELRVANFLKRLKKRMKPGDTVAKRWRIEEIEQEYRRSFSS